MAERVRFKAKHRKIEKDDGCAHGHTVYSVVPSLSLFRLVVVVVVLTSLYRSPSSLSIALS